jgi:2-haloacid dehalogenase
MTARPGTVVFDLGGVLYDWDPRYLYRQLFDGEDAMEDFLDTVCTRAWHVRQDAGRSIAEAVAEAKGRHPDKAGLIGAFYGRWPEMFRGAIDGTVEIMAELKAQGVPLYCLTNAPAETFPTVRSLYDYVGWFDGIVVSGEVGLIKPDRRIFELLLDKHAIRAEDAVFIDDLAENVEAARALGFHGIHFTAPERLRSELVELGLL